MIGTSGLAAGAARTAWLWRNRTRFHERDSREQPRLLVDLSAIIRHDAQTGIQRVVRAVWSELSRRSGEGFLVQPVFASRTNGYCHAPLNLLNRAATLSRAAKPVGVRAGDRFLGLDLSAHLLPHYRKQLSAWKAHGASIHLIVYDLLPLLRPEWFTSASVYNFRKWYDVLRSDADQAICISEQVANDLRQRLAGGRGPSIVRMRMGADIAGSVPSTGVPPQIEELVRRLQFRPAILMVGTVEPRKGYEPALAAFEWLWRTRPAEAPDLVIVGKPGWKTSQLQTNLREHAERGARLHWLMGVSDEALCKLYEACAGVLVASYAEGFGLPLLEATMFRRYALARDLPVFREQRLPNVEYFGDDNAAVLGEKIVQLADGGKRQPAPSAALPSWADCVDGLLHQMGFDGGEPAAESALRRAS
ncbi:MAG: glycosyltransferase family 4 protein [Myxococcales bacterium]